MNLSPDLKLIFTQNFLDEIVHLGSESLNDDGLGDFNLNADDCKF